MHGHLSGWHTVERGKPSDFLVFVHALLQLGELRARARKHAAGGMHDEHNGGRRSWQPQQARYVALRVVRTRRSSKLSR